MGEDLIGKKSFKTLLAVFILVCFLLVRYKLPVLGFFALVPLFYLAERGFSVVYFLTWSIVAGLLLALFEQSYLFSFSFWVYIGSVFGYGICYFMPIAGLFFLAKRFLGSLNDLQYPLIIVIGSWIYNFGYFSCTPFSFADSLAYFPGLLKFLSWGGEYSLVFFIAGFNFLIFRLFFSSQKVEKFLLFKKLMLLCIFFAFFNFFIIPFFNEKISSKSKGEKLEILLVQGNLLASDVNGNNQEIFSNQNFELKKLLNLTKEGIKEKKVDLIVWPEKTPQEPLFKEINGTRVVAFPKPWIQEVIAFVNKERIPLLLSAFVESFQNPEHFYNAVVLVEPQKEIEQVYYKEKLVFLGEYVPSWAFFLKKIKRNAGWMNDVISGKDIPNNTGIFNLNGNYFGVVICFENGFYEKVRQLRLAGADFIVNLSNDEIFRSIRELNYQEKSSIFRSIENRVEFLRATNVGFTEIISSQGELFSKLPPYKEGYLQGEVNIIKGTTPFVILASFLNPWFYFLLFFGQFFIKKLKR